jgi:hypothetical protein
MTEQQVERIVSDLLGQYGWMFVVGFTVLTFKNIIQRLVEGIMFFIKTVFYIYHTERKLIIRNDKLSSLNLEKTLPQNGSKKDEDN